MPHKYRARIVRDPGELPEWVDVSGKPEAVTLTDMFVSDEWHSLDFYHEGRRVSAVRAGAGDGTAVIMAVIQGGKE